MRFLRRKRAEAVNMDVTLEQVMSVVASARADERKKALALPFGLIQQVAATRQAVEDARDMFNTMAAQVADANRTIGELRAQIRFLGQPELLLGLAGTVAALQAENPELLTKALASAGRSETNE